MKSEKEKSENENMPKTYEIGKKYETRNKHIYCIKHKGNCTKKHTYCAKT